MIDKPLTPNQIAALGAQGMAHAQRTFTVLAAQVDALNQHNAFKGAPQVDTEPMVTAMSAATSILGALARHVQQNASGTPVSAQATASIASTTSIRPPAAKT
jgi:hypothetical protein